MNSEVTPFAFGLCHRRRNLLSLQPPMSLCVCHTKAKFCAAQLEIKALGHSQQNKRVKPKESKRQRKGLRDKDQPQIWYFIHIRSGAEVQFKVHKTKIQKRSAPRFCCSLSPGLQWHSHLPGNKAFTCIMQNHRAYLISCSWLCTYSNMYFRHF